MQVVGWMAWLRKEEATGLAKWIEGVSVIAVDGR